MRVRRGGRNKLIVGPANVEIRAIDDPTDLTSDTVLVRPRISARTKQRFETEGAGWFDGRRLVIRTPELIIDRDMPRTTARRDRAVNVLSGPVVSAVTMDALMAWPAPATSNRALARRADVSSGGVSLASRRLIEVGLLTEDRRATRGLFWAAANEWKPTWTETDIGSLGASAVEVGAAVAAAQGAPVMTTAGDAPELLVASEVDLQVASLRPKTTTTVLGRVAVAPSPIALGPDGGSESDGLRPADPVVVALVLATDPGRGAEIVEEWAGDHVWS